MSLHGTILSFAAALVLTTACTQGAGTDAPSGKPAHVTPADKPVSADTPADADQPTDKPADKPPMPVILPAGQTEPAARPGADASAPFVECTPDSRKAGVCTREYRPVCGKTAADARKTYANPCNACSDTTVIGYTAGACPTGAAP